MLKLDAMANSRQLNSFSIYLKVFFLQNFFKKVNVKSANYKGKIISSDRNFAKMISNHLLKCNNFRLIRICGSFNYSYYNF